jgi:hypothetical protein
MAYLISFAIVVLMTVAALIAIFSIAPLKRWAGLGNVAPTGLAAKLTSTPAA